MNSFDRIVAGVARRLGAWPLKAIGRRRRAEVLEMASEEMISVAAIPGGSIRFYAPSTLLLSRAESVLTKEADMIRWIDGFEDGAVFWDIGANVGVFSLYAGIRRRASVLSFEPSAANFYALSRNIQLNGLCDNITAYCIALSDRTELGVLNMASPSMGAALSQFGQPGDGSRYRDEGAQVTVHGMVGFSIDDFIARFNPPFPNFLKMDVDGLEVPILEGARATLRDPRIKSLIVELNLNNAAEHERAVSILGDAGFLLVSKGEIQGNRMELAANHLFERAQRPEFGAGKSPVSKYPLCSKQPL